MGCRQGTHAKELNVSFRQRGAWGIFEKVVRKEQIGCLEELNLLRTQEGVSASELWH